MNEPILDQAIDWLVKLESSRHAPAQAAACLAWRQADPRHEAAWQALHEAQACFGQARELPAGVAISALGSPDRRGALKLLALGLLGLATTGGVLQQSPWRVSLADYSTGIGERRRIALADGSELQLDSRSAVDVQFSARERLIVLREGQVYVKSAHDPQQRPLCVSTAQARLVASLQALDTAFDVCQQEGHTRLGVDTGAVAIQVPGLASVNAEAGEQYLIDATSARRLGTRAPGASAWTRGLLVTRDMPLQRLAEALGRQRAGWVGCDPAVAGLTISGVFQLDDTDNALRTLTHSLPVRLQWRTSLWVRILPA